MTDIYSREETELAVFGWIRKSFKWKYTPPEISKLVTKFWDDTNYFVLKGNEFESFLCREQNTYTHRQHVEAALRLATFTLTLNKTPKTCWTLQMIDNKTDKNGYLPIWLVYFEIFCDEIDYFYKDTQVFDTNNITKKWKDPALSLSKVNKLEKYIQNENKEKKVIFGCFIQILYKKYRIEPTYIYLSNISSRFDDYYKKIVMKQHIEYKWINCIKNKCRYSASFDHGNWCLKYTKNMYLYLKLLRIHGLIEKLVIECNVYILTKCYGAITFTKKMKIYCDNFKWIQLTDSALNIIECGVDIKILKAFKMTENVICKIPERYWYVYGIQIGNGGKVSKHCQNMQLTFNDDISVVDSQYKRN